MRIGRLVLLLLVVLFACSEDSTSPGSDTPPVETNVVHGLVSGNRAGGIAGFLVNASGASVFHVTQESAGPRITRVDFIEPDGTSFSIFNNTRVLARDFATGDLYASLIETAIDEINSFIQGNLDQVPAGAQAIAQELKKALDAERINPESLADQIHRYFTEAAIDCVTNPVECVNAFLEAIGEEETQIDDGEPASGDVTFGSGDLELVDSAGETTPVDDFAVFSVDPARAAAPVDVTALLSASAPLNYNGSGLAHDWYYEGGPNSTPRTLMGSGTSASVVLTQPGTYTITLIVKSARYGGSLATSSQTVEVLPAVVDPPTFTATPVGVSLPQTWSLVATDPSGNATSFDWSSSGGQTAQGQSTTMVFDTAGNFDITLTVSYADNSTAQAVKNVTVTDGGTGEVDPRVQEAFDAMAGTWRSTKVYVSNDNTGLWDEAKDVTWDGVNTRTTYTVTVDPVALTVAIEPGGKLIQFPPKVADYIHVVPWGLILGRNVTGGERTLSKETPGATITYDQVSYQVLADDATFNFDWRIRREDAVN